MPFTGKKVNFIMGSKKSVFRGSLFLVLLLLIVSCSKDHDDESSILGTWIETAPVAGRTLLHFRAGNKLTRVDGEGDSQEYNYRIEEKAIFLSIPDGTEGTTELFFEEINANTLKIENLYPSIPETDRTFIIFERE